MIPLPTADISIEIDGITYEGKYTVKIKSQLISVNSVYGSETTYTSIPSGYDTPLEDNRGLAERVLRQIVDKFLKETRKGKLPTSEEPIS